MAVKRWNGTSWDTYSANPNLNNTLSQWKKTAAGGETTLSGNDDSSVNLAYTVGQESVYINGVLQVRGSDYTATNGSSIVLVNQLVAGNIVQVISPLLLPMSSVIPLSTIAAKGDIMIGTASSVPARLPIGANDQVLVADSTSSNGMAWKSYGAQNYAGKNAIINGAFDIWQRGTSFATNYAYTADRWVAGADAGTFTASRSTDVPSTFTYSLSMAGTNTTSAQIYQIIESQNSAYMAGQTVTLTVYAKSTVGSSGLAWVTQIPNATDNWSGAATDQSGTFTASASGSWTRYSATFTVGANATRGYKIIIYRNVSATSSTTFYTGVQLELGSTATPFSRAGGDIQGELAKCERYYERFTPGVAYGRYCDVQYNNSATQVVGGIQFKTTKRVIPTSVDFSSIRIQENGIGAVGTVNSFGLNIEATTKLGQLSIGLTGGAAAGKAYALMNDNNSAGYIGFSAEL